MKKQLKRIAATVALGMALLAIAIMLIVWRMGSGTAQDWIGVQIQDIANAYLNPHLSFTDLSYQYPLTVSLKNLHLTADDPTRPGKKIDILACNQAVLSLGEIPRRGKPIVIEKILLDGPLITAEAVTPGSNDFAGFSNLMRNPSTKTPEKKAADDKKLSDVFRMRLVQLKDGKIVYDPRIAGTLPMALDQINTTLNIAPTETGWYKLDTTIARKPVFEINVGGELNLDSFSTRNLDIKVAADLGSDKLDYLPPELQVLLKKYEARGKLKMEVTGAVAVSDPTKGQVKINLDLDGANVAYNGLRIPVNNLGLSAEYGDGKATLKDLKIAVLGGSAEMSGSVLLNDRMDADLHLNVSHMVPEKLLADAKMASASPAMVDLDFTLAASLTSLLGKAPPKAGAPLAAIALKNFRISAADPTHTGQTVDVVACKNLEVAMSQPVISGKPIVVDKIVLDAPVISAIATAPGSNAFVGVPDLAAMNSESAGSAKPQAATAPATTSLARSGQLLTDIIRVNMFQLNGAKILYDPRIPGTVPMVIDSINTALNADAAHIGVYTIHTLISRAPAFSLGVDGAVDIDHPSLQDLKLDLKADLTQPELAFLPPQLQLLVKQSQAGGKLSLKAGVSVALAEPEKGHAQIDLQAEKLRLHQGDLDLPVDEVSISATLADGKISETAHVTALQNVFEISAKATLNDRIDADMVLKLKDVEIEKLLALVDPGKAALKTSTKISADVEVKSPVMVALGMAPAEAGAPLAAISVHNVRLTADDPTSPGKPLDFFTCDVFSTAITALPAAGKPAEVEPIVVKHPAIRAVATAPGGNEFAGIASLQAMAKAQATDGAANPVGTTAPATSTAQAKISDLVRLKGVTVSDVSLFYDPRIEGTVPMSLAGISMQVTPDSVSGDAYKFDVKVPQNVAMNGDVSGRINVDTLRVDPVNVQLALACGAGPATYLPPQVQQMLRPYNLSARVAVSAVASASLTDPSSAAASANVMIDEFAATFSEYRIPVDHIRLPVQMKNNQVTILKSDALGGPMINALGGTVNVTGTVDLNDRLDSNLEIAVDGVLLEDLMATKITPPRQELIGATQVRMKLVNAPLLVIAARAQPPHDQTSSSRPSNSSPSRLASLPLPANWGNADIELTRARLAGLELIQGMTNLAQSVFTDIFQRQNASNPRSIVPKESATVLCDFNGDHVDCSKIHYEGEVVAADGKGSVTLAQEVNLDMTGGPISKLGGLGAVGNWIKDANDSLLYYHICGPAAKPQFEVKRGDGKPIVQGVKKGAEIAGNGIKKGAGAVGGFLHGLTHHGDSDQEQK